MKRTIIKTIKVYQMYISPFFKRRCRFHPTCSEYAVLAVEKYGAFRGTIKSILRILRCNPFSDGGVDYP